MDSLTIWVKENVVTLVLGVVGVGLMVGGVGQMLASTEETEVEVIPNVEEVVKVTTVVVDVAGAVVKPGVFEMDEGSRVADALVAAGGLAEDADEEWVARRINQAEPVRDGMKIYVPLAGEQIESGGFQGEDGMVAGVGDGVVNVNEASAAQLDELWGIGEARAKDIIDNRPYESLEELMTKAGVPKNVMEKNEGKMSVY